MGKIIAAYIAGCVMGYVLGLILHGVVTMVRKRKNEQEARIRELEKQLFEVENKCVNTQKACRILSDIVKENYKTEEKEAHETSKISWTEIDKINALNMGHQINRREIEEMVNSTHSVLYPQTCGELYASCLYPQTSSIISQQECSVEDLTLRNMALMQNCCSVSAEEAQKRIFHALYPGWRLPDDPN